MTFDIILVKGFEHLSSADTINLVIENLRRTQKRVRHGRDKKDYQKQPPEMFYEKNCS